jgi:hypothetical protein
LRKLIDNTTGVCVIAALHACFVYVQFDYLTIFNNTPQMAVLFIPAAVRVFSVIIFGYWAGLGIALGTLIHDFYLHPLPQTLPETVLSASQQGTAVSLSLLIWALLSNKINCVNNPQIDFPRINAFDVLQMCLIQAIINSVTAHIFYILAPSIHLQFDWYYFAVMLVGDLTGAFLIFILANVIFSVFKRTPLFPRKHYDDTMNNQ